MACRRRVRVGAAGFVLERFEGFTPVQAQYGPNNAFR